VATRRANNDGYPTDLGRGKLDAYSPHLRAVAQRKSYSVLRIDRASGLSRSPPLTTHAVVVTVETVGIITADVALVADIRCRGRRCRSSGAGAGCAGTGGIGVCVCCGTTKRGGIGTAARGWRGDWCRGAVGSGPHWLVKNALTATGLYMCPGGVRSASLDKLSHPSRRRRRDSWPTQALLNAIEAIDRDPVYGNQSEPSES
jgi:hypothetical protein